MTDLEFDYLIVGAGSAVAEMRGQPIDMFTTKTKGTEQ